MSLADRRAAPVTTEACPVAELLARLPAEDAATLRSWLEPNVWESGQIRKALAMEDHRVTSTALDAHKARVARIRGLSRSPRPCSCEVA